MAVFSQQLLEEYKNDSDRARPLWVRERGLKQKGKRILSAFTFIEFIENIIRK